MLLRADVLASAVQSVDRYKDYRILYTSPKGKPFTQALAKELSKEDGLIVIAGYYEGVDERIFHCFDIECVSMGDFVLSSGEQPALMIAEAALRLIPGVVGKAKSVEDDSIVTGLLEYPQFTTPRVVSGIPVPPVLLSGHHKKIKEWRRVESLKETLYRRPSLLGTTNLSDQDKRFLEGILKEELEHVVNE